MKTITKTLILALQFVLVCFTSSVYAGLITFDNTTSAATYITSDYSEDGYDFSFSKGMYFVDSAYTAWTGLSAFSGDALHFNSSSSSAIVRSSDGSAFSLISLFAGTLRSSANDQGFVYFDGLRSNGELISAQIYAANKASEFLFSDLTDLIQLTIHRDTLNFPVIDDLVLVAFQPHKLNISALQSAQPVVQASEPGILALLLLSLMVLPLSRVRS